MRISVTPWALGSAALAGLVLAGCSGGSQIAGSHMMGGGMGASGDGSGYHYSTLSCAAPSNLPGQTVSVLLGDMGMTQMMSGTAPLGAHMMLRTTPATVLAGKVSLVASNMGWRTHELVIMPLAPGVEVGARTAGPDGKVAETGSLGEASARCGAGTGEGIPAGSVSWTTVTLTPGRYELICNLANHYADGMHQELLVTS